MKIKTKTVPVSKLIKASVTACLWDVATGMVVKSLLNNVVVTAGGVGGSVIGNELDGERGALLGSVVGSFGSAK